MDPLSIATASISLAAFAVKLAVGIDECIEAIKTTDDTFKILALELKALEQTLNAVDTSLHRPNLKDSFRKTVSEAEFETQLASFDALLKDCKTALEELEQLLNSITSGRLAHGILRKPAAAWKLNSKAPALGRIQSLVKTYNSTMHINLQIMNL
jgi:hypothetical protein